MADQKTFKQWMLEGRRITKGAQAASFLVNDDRTESRALFTREQTDPIAAPDTPETEGWTIVIPAEEWEEIKAQKRAARRQPKVRIRRPQEGAGVEIWCGPDADIIALLRARGFSYQPQSHYWRHANKDPVETATRFEQGKIRDQRVRVEVAWDRSEGLDL